jgi:hypothetical protein
MERLAASVLFIKTLVIPNPREARVRACPERLSVAKESNGNLFCACGTSRTVMVPIGIYSFTSASGSRVRISKIEIEGSTRRKRNISIRNMPIVPV